MRLSKRITKLVSTVWCSASWGFTINRAMKMPQTLTLVAAFACFVNKGNATQKRNIGSTSGSLVCGESHCARTDGVVENLHLCRSIRSCMCLVADTGRGSGHEHMLMGRGLSTSILFHLLHYMFDLPKQLENLETIYCGKQLTEMYHIAASGSLMQNRRLDTNASENNG